MTESKLERLEAKRTKLIIKIQKLDKRILQAGGKSIIE